MTFKSLFTGRKNKSAHISEVTVLVKAPPGWSRIYGGVPNDTHIADYLTDLYAGGQWEYLLSME